MMVISLKVDIKMLKYMMMREVCGWLVYCLIVVASCNTLHLIDKHITVHQDTDIFDKLKSCKNAVVWIWNSSGQNVTGFYTKYGLLSVAHLELQSKNVSVIDYRAEFPEISEVFYKDETRDLMLIDRKRMRKNPKTSSLEEVYLELAPRNYKIQPGEKVYVIGHLAGVYPSVITIGRVTKVDKKIISVIPLVVMDCFEVDAGIWYGSSGSPVLNENLQVIGVINRIRMYPHKIISNSDSEGGIAISLNTIYEFLDTIKQNNN